MISFNEKHEIVDLASDMAVAYSRFSSSNGNDEWNDYLEAATVFNAYLNSLVDKGK